MNREQYRLAREQRGTQKEVSSFLRVSRVTIARRESGKIAITHEATLALLAMPARPPISAEQEQTSFAEVKP